MMPGQRTAARGYKGRVRMEIYGFERTVLVEMTILCPREYQAFARALLGSTAGFHHSLHSTAIPRQSSVATSIVAVLCFSAAIESARVHEVPPASHISCFVSHDLAWN